MIQRSRKVLRPGRSKSKVLVLLALLAVLTGVSQIPGQVAPLSLFPPRIFEDPQIGANFIADRQAAIRLGKALFWDMQVGSDGVQACASCHFHAGADPRFTNQLSPGLPGGDSEFGNSTFFGTVDFPLFGPNYSLLPSDFPFHDRVAQDDQEALVLRDTNDVASSQGVVLSEFVDIIPGSAEEITAPLTDPIFQVNGVNVRRVEPRNAPTVINAIFNFDNFMDGRANNVFNGQNPFGHLDDHATVLDNSAGILQEIRIRIRNSSLASQAVGPPLSAFEMSADGRNFPKIGKKMLTLKPLAKQRVHPNDSVLGPIADTTTGKGLTVSYGQLIRQAFQPRWWNSNNIMTFSDDEPPTFEHVPGTEQSVTHSHPTINPPLNRPLTTDEFTHMETNFALFFGLALQLYQSTLVADDTPFDRFLRGNTAAMSEQAQRGLGRFVGQGQCIACHVGTALTAAAITAVLGLEDPDEPEGLVEFMNMAGGGQSFYDSGFYNISVRPTSEDIGRGGTAPILNPLTPGEEFPLSHSRLAILKRDGLLPPEVAAFEPDLPVGETDPPDRVAVDGAIKTPGLRNVELTGPYFRDGSAATLEQVVEFYSRGGNFPDNNSDNLDPAIVELGLNEDQEVELVAFLRALTDERVRNESAPFDHPELFVPNGHNPDGSTILFRITPVGRFGRSAEGLGPLQPFLTPLEIQHLPDPGDDPGLGVGGGGSGGGGCFISALGW